MASLRFFLRSSSRPGGAGSLCARIIYRRKIKVITTPYQLHAQEWDTALFCAKDNGITERSKYIEETNAYLLVLSEHFSRLRAGQPASDTVNDIALLLFNNLCSLKSLSAYSNRLISHMQSRGQLRTARAYRSSVECLFSFTRKRILLVEDISPELITRFEQHLKAQGKSLNTISFYMRSLRAIYRKAIEEGLVEQKGINPFKTVFTGFSRTPKRALDTTQMQRIQQLSFKHYLHQDRQPESPCDRKLYKAWRLFIFCFHARGMCFVDLAYLKKENVRGNSIRYYRKKTGGMIELHIDPLMKSIIESFARDTAHSPYLFPIIRSTGSAQAERLQYETALRRQNLLLKELAKMAGINSPLSTHVARHSWATIAKRENLPLWVISEGLGHSSQKVTHTYLAGFERSRLDRANEIVCAAILSPHSRPPCREELFHRVF
ncbi:MAG: site-specific integrase [Dysgonamonadaceae bacterium]|jgi:integrase|nr:site-specific integrase [Dysgonamonadaceae bacterium]